MASIVLEEAQTARGRKRADNELLGIANDTKDALLSAIGHDLWPPLSVIAGFAETLRRDATRMSKADREAVKRIADNAERIEEVLRRLLSVSEDLRVMGKPGWSRIDLGGIVADVLRRARPSTQEIHVSAESLPVLRNQVGDDGQPGLESGPCCRKRFPVLIHRLDKDHIDAGIG